MPLLQDMLVSALELWQMTVVKHHVCCLQLVHCFRTCLSVHLSSGKYRSETPHLLFIACPLLCMSAVAVFMLTVCADCVLQYADPVADLLDKWGVFRARLFRESCVFHRGNYVKVSYSFSFLFSAFQDTHADTHCLLFSCVSEINARYLDQPYFGLPWQL